MKKLFALMLVICMLIPLTVSCTADKSQSGITSTTDTDGTSDTSDSDVTTDTASDSESTPNYDVPADAVINTWVVEGYEKVLLDDKLPEDASNEIDLHMARNEKESFHIAFYASVNIEGLKINVIEGARDDISIEMFDEYYIKTRRKSYPDPIVPFDGIFETTAKKNKSFLIRFGTTADTKSGNYTYKFNITDHSGNVISEYKVNLTVWDFALPETFSSDSAIGINLDYITSMEKLPGRIATQYYMKYYEMLLDYGFTAYDLPFDILNDKADAYMSDPRVKSFRVDIYNTDEKIIKIYEKLKTNPEWLEKAYFYPYDEPCDIAALDYLAKRCEHLREIAPEIKIMIPFYKNVQYNDTMDEVDFLDQYVDIWCPKAPAWNGDWLGNPLGRDYFGDRMEEKKAEGDKVWWYVCWEPGPPYCNLYVDEAGIDHVILFWQQYLCKSDGFLYWCSNYWKYTDNPWEDMRTVKWLSNDVFGDGSLFYNGGYVGIEGPVASLRLECMRNGTEDIELLKIAEELLGREWVDEQVVKVTSAVNKHNSDNDNFNAVREFIGNAVEEALKAK